MSEHDAELIFEQERNKDYIVTLGRKKVYRIQGTDLRALSKEWGPLLGRVSLGQSREDDNEFYVGPRSAILVDEVRVVSWASPAASVLFNATKSWRGQEIRVKRRFHIRGHQVAGFTDAWIKRDGKEAFPAPDRPERPRPRPGGSARGRASADGGTMNERAIPNNLAELERRRQIQEAMRANRHAAWVAQANRPVEDPNQAFLREHPHLAAELDTGSLESTGGTVDDEVVNSLRAPRGEALKSILPTLRPSQFQAVTADPLVTHIFAGHPGTGKTVIATHRAAWLTNRDGATAMGSILAVGPTDSWATHVGQVIKELGEGDSVIVRSLTGVFNFVLESEWVLPIEKDDYICTDASLGHAILSITGHLTNLTFQKGYQRLRAYRSPDGSNLELDRWCEELPMSLDEALRRTELWPALSLLKIRTERVRRFEHIVVDEAQDIRPLEWMVLQALNDGQWTIVGDLNQRRTAFTPPTWADVVGHLDIDRHQVVELDQGFRTTQQITDFASKLLGKRARARASAALGQGEPPTVVNARAEGRTVERVGLSEVRRLAKKHPQGRIAVITPDVKRVMEAALKGGWERAGAKNRVGVYRTTDQAGRPLEFHLLNPYQARGLEFDGVVVVEPADFPTLLGKFGAAGTHGPLYTSLTRANLSLSVVHWKPLPKPLVERR